MLPGIRSRHNPVFAWENEGHTGSVIPFGGLRTPHGAVPSPQTPPRLPPSASPLPPLTSILPLFSPLQAMFPDVLNYLSFIIEGLWMAPPVMGLCHYMGYVRSFTSSVYTSPDRPS